MPPEKPKETEPAPATENPATEKSEGRSSPQEFESRLTQQEEQGKTYATREWVFKWALSIFGFLLLALLYFNKELILLFIKLRKGLG